MKDTDKVTLTVGQLKRLINESASSENWCVVRFGGSIGTKFTHRLGGKSCIVYQSGLTEEEAKEEAKQNRKFLTPGERQYYGYTYRAVPEKMLKSI